MKSWSLGWVTSLVIIGLAITLMVTFLASGQPQTPQWSYSELVTHAQAGDVKDVTISGGSATATDKKGTKYDVTLPDQTATLASDLTAAGVNVHYQSTNGLGSTLPSLLPNLLFFALIGGLLWWVYRRASRGPQNQAMSFGRSTARLAAPKLSEVTFAHVAGVDEAKQVLAEVVEFLRSPQRFRKMGARIPKGVPMVGPPGSGKTLLARAVAGEAEVPFFSISGSEFVEMFVGVGASRVRDLFDRAKKASPCTVFVDEIDAVGRQRGAGLGGGNDEREQTLNQLLVEMDGFATDTHVIVIAGTNRPDVLDPALLRPGRFDRRVVLDRPDVRGRRAILDVHARNKPLAADVDLDVLARQWGMSERLGAVAMGENQELVFLGRDLGERRNYSEKMASLIDDEVRRIVEDARGTASRVLAERQGALRVLAERLIAQETIDGEELELLLASGDAPAHPVTVVG